MFKSCHPIFRKRVTAFYIYTMGDRRRFQEMTRFVQRNYPRAENILCVADGKGDLAKLLTKSNFNCKIIDPVSLRHKQLDYERKYFTRDYDSEDYDLILGLHPDHATAEIILNAKRLKKKFAIVPCCVLGDEAKGVGDGAG